MSVRVDDLPAHVRRRLGIDATTRSKPKPSRAGTSDRVPCPGTCCACGETFASYAAWERHADKTGHPRWTINLPEAAA